MYRWFSIKDCQINTVGGSREQVYLWFVKVNTWPWLYCELPDGCETGYIYTKPDSWTVGRDKCLKTRSSLGFIHLTHSTQNKHETRRTNVQRFNQCLKSH